MVLDQGKKKYPNPTTIAESLVADGADPNDANQGGFTCLMYAARNGHFETTQHLLGLPGIDPNKCNNVIPSPVSDHVKYQIDCLLS